MLLGHTNCILSLSFKRHYPKSALPNFSKVLSALEYSLLENTAASIIGFPP